mgnify:CR=1 FL=1
MSDTFTNNLNLTKPQVGGSVDSWGTKISGNLDTIDSIFSADGTEINARFNSANFDDNKKALFGTGDDLEIYHDGTGAIIKNDTGILNIKNDDIRFKTSGDETTLRAVANGSVELMHNNSTKISTSSSGVSVTGDIAVSGNVDGRDIATDGTKLDGIASGATNVTNNNQLTNGAGYVTTDTNTTYTAGTGLNLSGTTFEISLSSGNALPNNSWVTSTEGQKRFYFSGGTTTYFGTGSSYAFRNASDVDVFTIDGSGNGAFDGNVTAYYSDERLKDKQGKIENALDKVSKIETFYFKENELAKSLGHNNDKMQVGVSAQSVKAVLPEIIDLAPFDIDTETKESKSGEDYMTVDYAKLTPLLIEAIKELKDELKELRGV